MFWKRRGISPLIATVLIIGFTVALAAIIMTWGTTFSKSMQKSTEATTEEQLSCAQDVLIDASSACVVDNPTNCYITANTATSGKCRYVRLTLKNDGSKDILRVSARLYKNANTVFSNPSILPSALTAYGLKTIDIDLGATQAAITVPGEEVTLVEIIPVIKVGEKELTCAATKDYFGDQNYEESLPKCA